MESKSSKYYLNVYSTAESFSVPLSDDLRVFEKYYLTICTTIEYPGIFAQQLLQDELITKDDSVQVWAHINTVHGGIYWYWVIAIYCLFSNALLVVWGASGESWVPVGCSREEDSWGWMGDTQNLPLRNDSSQRTTITSRRNRSNRTPDTRLDKPSITAWRLCDGVWYSSIPN